MSTGQQEIRYGAIHRVAATTTVGVPRTYPPIAVRQRPGLDCLASFWEAQGFVLHDLFGMHVFRALLDEPAVAPKVLFTVHPVEPYLQRSECRATSYRRLQGKLLRSGSTKGGAPLPPSPSHRLSGGEGDATAKAEGASVDPVGKWLDISLAEFDTADSGHDCACIFALERRGLHTDARLYSLTAIRDPAAAKPSSIGHRSDA